MFTGIHAYGTKAIQEAKRHQLGNLIWIPKWGYGLGSPAGTTFPEGGWAEDSTNGYSPDAAVNPALPESILASVREAVRQQMYFFISGRRGLGDEVRHGGFGYGGDCSGDFLPPALLQEIEEIAGEYFLGVHLEELDSDFCQNALAPSYMARCPWLFDYETREDGRKLLEGLFREYVKRYREWGTEALLNTTLTYHHYAFRAGCRLVLAEVMEHLTSVSVQYAYLRGAKKQYGGNWGVWVSPWYWGQVPTDDKKLWPSPYAAENGGHSAFSFAASLWEALFSGSVLFTHQETEPVFIQGADDSHWELGKWGKVIQSFSKFVMQEKEARVPMVDTALLLDLDCGWSTAGNWQSWDMREQGESCDTVWAKWKASEEDRMIPAVLNLFYPEFYRSGTAELRTQEQEYPGYFSKTPFGPVDVLLSDCNAASLESYRLVVAAGKICWTPELAEALCAYLRNGGILLMNAAQLAEAPENVKQAFGIREIGEVRRTEHIVQADDTPYQLLCGDQPHDLREYVGRSFYYRPMIAEGACIAAHCRNGDSVIFVHPCGTGLAVASGIDGLLRERGPHELLRVERELLESLVQKAAAIRMDNSEDMQYLADTMPDGSLQILLINHGRHDWEGSLTLENKSFSQVKVLFQTEDASARMSDGTLWCKISRKSLAVLQIS